MGRFQNYVANEAVYGVVQAQQPQTLADALADSPVASSAGTPRPFTSTAAHDAPDLLVKDIRQFFAALYSGEHRSYCTLRTCG